MRKNITEITIINEMNRAIIIQTIYRPSATRWFFHLFNQTAKNEITKGAQRLEPKNRLTFDCRPDDSCEIIFHNLNKPVECQSMIHKNIHCFVLSEMYDN